jgi:hypothetical protein
MISKNEMEDYFILTIQYNMYGTFHELQLDLTAMLTIEYPEMTLKELDKIMIEFDIFYQKFRKKK